jgi:hypothetical protein
MYINFIYLKNYIFLWKGVNILEIDIITNISQEDTILVTPTKDALVLESIINIYQMEGDTNIETVKVIVGNIIERL